MIDHDDKHYSSKSIHCGCIRIHIVEKKYKYFLNQISCRFKKAEFRLNVSHVLKDVMSRVTAEEILIACRGAGPRPGPDQFAPRHTNAN